MTRTAALDYIGQARAVLTLAGQREAAGHDEDQLAFLREERDYLNFTLVELPRGDFAVAVLRIYLLASVLRLVWASLATSSRGALRPRPSRSRESGLIGRECRLVKAE